MGRRARIVARALQGAAAVALVLVVAAAVLAGLAGTRAARDKVAAALSRRAGGPVTFDTMALVLLPRPGLVLRQVAFATAGTVSGAAQSLEVYPEILPLLAGDFRPARLAAESPSVAAELPARTRKPGEAPLPLEALEVKFAALLADAASRAPGLAVSARGGRLDLVTDGRVLFALRDVDGSVDLPPGALAFRLTCRSDFFDRLSAKATLEPRRFVGQGTIEVLGFRPGPLVESLFPDRAFPGADSVADIAAGIRAGGIGVLAADIRGTTAALSLTRGERTRTVRSVRASGTVRVEPGKTSVDLRELSVGTPGLELAGRLLLDRTARLAKVEANVREADLSSARDTALALAGDVAAVRTFFDVVRGGRLSSAAVRVAAASPGELGDPANVVADARLAGGSIHVPGIGLDFAAVDGDVSIREGILHGRRLATRLGNSRGRDGTMTLGLSPGNPVFRLDTTVDADLSELPPLLTRLVRSRAVRDEISRVEDLRGEAHGRLVLGDSTASVRARFDASDVRLSGRYRRVPFPVAVTGGAIAYDGSALRVRGVDGAVGGSTVRGLSGRIALGPVPSIDDMSGTFSIALGEIFPWLASFAGSGGAMKGIGGLEGTAVLDVARLRGPLLSPRRWEYAVAGEARDVAAATTAVPGRVVIERGRFRAGPDALSFTDVRGRVLDASLAASGALRGPGPGSAGYDLSLDGSIGPEAAAAAAKLAGLPPGLHVAAPVTLGGGRLSRTEGGAASFSGTLGFRDGPVVALRVRRDADGFAVDRLDIRDAESDASIAWRAGANGVSARFSGTLTHGTANRILSGEPVPRGRLSGDIEAVFLPGRNERITARGTLEGRDLVLPLGGGSPLAIERISLEAIGAAIRINASAASWMEQRFAVAGELRYGPGGPRVDLDIVSDRIDADRIAAGLAAPGDAGPRAPDALPLSGTVHVASGLLQWGRLAWSPFRADIALSPGRATISLDNAAVCGIETSGSIEVAPGRVSVDVGLLAANREIRPALECLGGPKYAATGRFTLRGHVRGQGAPGSIARALEGEFVLEAGKGRIHALNALSNLLAVVNVTELFRGRSPGLGKKGFAYNSIRAAGTLAGGKIRLEEGADIDGASMGIVARGAIDIVDRNVDMVALVAPLRTVDAIVRKIPVVRYILGGSLVSIPVGVRGDIDDPKTTLLPASAVGEGMLGILERALKAPVKIVEPIIRRR